MFKIIIILIVLLIGRVLTGLSKRKNIEEKIMNDYKNQTQA